MAGWLIATGRNSGWLLASLVEHIAGVKSLYFFWGISYVLDDAVLTLFSQCRVMSKVITVHVANNIVLVEKNSKSFCETSDRIQV